MKFKVILIYFFVCFRIVLVAQNITPSKIPLLDRLPVSAIHRLFQDSEGYIWYGTVDGLCRDDGYNIQVFRSGLETPNLFVNNEIACIAEDKEDKLWVGTAEGLYILDKSDYRIYPFSDTRLSDKDITTIYVSSDGSIWISLMGILLKYAPDGRLLKEYPIEQNGKQEQINNLYEDRDHNLWMTSWQGGIRCLPKDSDNIRLFPTISENIGKTTIIQDKDNPYFWISSWGKGLIRFHPDAPPDSMYIYQPIARNHMNTPDGTCLHMKQDHIYGYLWVTGVTDLYAFRQQGNGMLEQVDIYSFLPRINKMLNEIIEDNNNNLWISAFDRESFILDLKDHFLKNYPVSALKKQLGSNPAIMAICEDDDGTFWFLQERMGLYTYNAKTEELKYYKDFPQIINLDLGAVVTFEKSKQNGKLWVAPLSNTVIYQMSQRDLNMHLDKEVNLTHTVQNPGNVQILHEDHIGNLWIGTTKGLFIHSPKSNTSLQISSVSGKVSAITQTTDDTIWVCTEEGYLYKIKSPEEIENFNLQKDFMAMDATSDGILWLGTKQGNIYHYTPDTGELIDYSTTTGMTGSNVYKIVVDMYNHLWIESNQKLTEFNPSNGAYRNYFTSDEELFLNRFLPRSVTKNKNGIIYFAGIPGFISVTPSQHLESIPQNVKVHITNVNASGKTIMYGLNKLSSGKEHLELPHNVQNLEIQFSSLNHLHANKIRYAYQLKGVDSDWTYIGNGRNSAFYNQLNKGVYTFQVKATDENGLWSNQIEEFTIHRLPAFYETWWAYTLYLLLAILMLWGILYLYLQRVKDQNDKKFSEKVNQMKLRYFTNISHELLTPLTIISCVADDLEASDKQEYTEIKLLHANVFRLRRLLQQVLDLRKVDSGNMALKVSHNDIIAFIREICYTGFSPLIKKKNINFSFSSDSDELEACFDRDKLDKIIYNLLSNAFKYTTKGKSVWVNIKSEQQNNHTYAIITVGDEGVGIAAKELSQIFVRFYNNKLSIETGSSNGIGLSLTKDLVELHHGSISVESQKGKGSVFTIQIPIDKESYSINEFSESSITFNQTVQTTSTDNEANGINEVIPVDKQARILLVEDNEELIALMQNILSRKYEVFTAGDGVEALNVLQKHEIDVVISDVMMPNMDGWELCRKIRSEVKTSHIIVILLTAKTQTEDQVDSYKAGANAYITKPFQMRVLDARLENLLQNKQKMHQQFRNNMQFEISDLEITSLDEQFIQKAITTVEAHLDEENFDITFFASQVNMSRSTLSRKLKSLTGLTPLEFIRNIKMQHAKKMLANKKLSISEVANALGYFDRKYFTNCFKEEFGITPKEYQKETE